MEIAKRYSLSTMKWIQRIYYINRWANWVDDNETRTCRAVANSSKVKIKKKLNEEKKRILHVENWKRKLSHKIYEIFDLIKKTFKKYINLLHFLKLLN